LGLSRTPPGSCTKKAEDLAAKAAKPKKGKKGKSTATPKAELKPTVVGEVKVA
jgi:hypothetical protein